MKIRIFMAILIMAATMTISATAQSTKTRNEAFGVTNSSCWSYRTITATDTVGATVDTVEFRAGAAAVTYVTFTMKDSTAFRLKSTGGAYRGDIVKMDIVNSGPTAPFNLVGNWIVSTGTKKLSSTTATRWHLEFYFDGKNFVETSRLANYTY